MKIRKPMRLEEDLIVLVEKHGQGQTFTSKMEYILDDYFNTIPKKKAEFEKYDDMIVNARKEYQRLQDKINDVKDKFDDFVSKLRWSIR